MSQSSSIKCVHFSCFRQPVVDFNRRGGGVSVSGCSSWCNLSEEVGQVFILDYHLGHSFSTSYFW